MKSDVSSGVRSDRRFSREAAVLRFRTALLIVVLPGMNGSVVKTVPATRIARWASPDASLVASSNEVELVCAPGQTQAGTARPELFDARPRTERRRTPVERIMRARPSPGTVIALVALFVALGGTAFSAIRIGSSEVVNNSLVSRDLKNRKGVKDADVVPNSLTGKAIREAKLGRVPRARQAGMLDGLDSSAFLGVSAKAADAEKVDGLDANSLIRIASASTTDAPNAVGDNDVLTTSITAPRTGFLHIVASVEALNTATDDIYNCGIEVDGADVDSSIRGSTLNGAGTNLNEDEDCSTNTVTSVSSGPHAVVFEVNSIDVNTELDGADLGVLFVPFDATGG